jgi:iron complex transport system permease protein
LITAGFVYLIAGRQSINLLIVILAGMAVSSLLGGAISAVLLFSRQYEVAQFIFWTMGGLEGRMWKHIAPVLPLMLFVMLWVLLQARALNVLSLGDENAHGMGLNVRRSKLQILLLVAFLTALAISVAGPIAFVGLMVPHIIRLMFGPDHRLLLPLSAYLGALLVLLSDWFGRVVIAPHEIKVGIITAIVGGSYFIFLILRLQRTGRLL